MGAVMTRDKYYDLIEIAYKSRLELSRRKNAEYCLDDNPFDSFGKLGITTGVDPLIVWLVLAGKHWLSVTTYIQQTYLSSTVESPLDRTESMSGRIDDLQNYLDLLRGMLIERGLIGG